MTAAINRRWMRSAFLLPFSAIFILLTTSLKTYAVVPEIVVDPVSGNAIPHLELDEALVEMNKLGKKKESLLFCKKIISKKLKGGIDRGDFNRSPWSPVRTGPRISG